MTDENAECSDCSHGYGEHTWAVLRDAQSVTWGCEHDGCRCKAFTFLAEINAGPGYNITVKL